MPCLEVLPKKQRRRLFAEIPLLKIHLPGLKLKNALQKPSGIDASNKNYLPKEKRGFIDFAIVLLIQELGLVVVNESWDFPFIAVRLNFLNPLS